MEITNATVERAYKPDDYGTRRVTLSANIGPNDEHHGVLAYLMGLAEHHARTTPGTVQEAVTAVAEQPTKPTRGKGASPPPLPPSSPFLPGGAFFSPPSPPAPPPVPPPVPPGPYSLPPAAALPAIPQPAPAPLPLPPQPPSIPLPTVPAPVVPGMPGVAPVGGIPPVSGVALPPHLTNDALRQLCGMKVQEKPEGAERDAFGQRLIGFMARFTGDPKLGCDAIKTEWRQQFYDELRAFA